jgi:23S rRNA (adenine2503-C2)-methyltransferase
LAQEGENVTHIVVMGTGEPFDNYDNVLAFVHIMNEQSRLSDRRPPYHGQHLRPRRWDRKYAKEGIQINLAISLHAPN